MSLRLSAVLAAAVLLASLVAAGIVATSASAGPVPATYEDQYAELGESTTVCDQTTSSVSTARLACRWQLDMLGALKWEVQDLGTTRIAATNTALSQLRSLVCGAGTVPATQSATTCAAGSTNARLDLVEQKLASVDGRLVQSVDKLDLISSRVEQTNTKLDQLHTDLVALTDAVEAQGPNTPGGNTANGASDDAPMFVRLSSLDETRPTLEQATMATREDLWFIAGLVLVGSLVAPPLTRMLRP